MKRASKSSNAEETREESGSPILHANLTAIEVAEKEILDELLLDKQVGPFVSVRLSDCVAVVSPGKGNLLVKALLKAGHTPKVI